MTPYDLLSESLSDLKNGKRDLLSHYALYWETGFKLKADQFIELLEATRKVAGNSPEANCWADFSEGFCYTYFPDKGNAYDFLSSSAIQFEKLGDRAGLGAAQCLLAVHFKNVGQLEQAQAHVQQAITNIGTNSAFGYFRGISYYQAGEINHLLKDFDQAIRYFEEGLNEIDATYEGMQARVLNGLGTIHADKAEYDRAYRYYNESLRMSKGQNNYLLDSKNYADIGNYYFRLGDIENAFAYQEKSISIRRERNLNNPLITNYMDMAEIHLQQKNFTRALEFATMAEKLAAEMKIIIKLYQAHRILSLIYEEMQQPAEALHHFKTYHRYRDEVLNQESARRIKQISMHHEVESAQKEKEIFQLRNVELKQALDEIGASVRYARRIQEAILPSSRIWKECLPDSFVLYKPKDVVAGDFYWMEHAGSTVLFAAADCTGHGVPGAMVSVICSNALNSAVKEYRITSPSDILNKTRELVLEQFRKSDDEVSDGMDISLCALNIATGELNWSGANNPLWMVRDDKLTEIAPDKQPIGNYIDPKPFTLHTVQLRKGDCLYILTDGYADQFGGPKGKKFRSRALQQLITNSSAMPMSEQVLFLEKAFADWKGPMEQVDDVCVIGVRY